MWSKKAVLKTIGNSLVTIDTSGNLCVATLPHNLHFLKSPSKICHTATFFEHFSVKWYFHLLTFFEFSEQNQVKFRIHFLLN